MKTHVSYHDLPNHKHIEKELQRQEAKLAKRLKKVHPDLVTLHVSLVRRTRSVTRYISSVTLRLPSGTLNAGEEAAQPVISLKHAMSGLLRELTKHQAKLRSEPDQRRARRKRTLPHKINL